MAMSGISSLITLAQLKQQNANESALEGANKQRGLIKQMKDLRGQERALDDKLRDKVITSGERNQIADLLDQADLDGSSLGDLRNETGGEHAGSAVLGAEGRQATNQDVADALKQQFADAISDLEAQDKLGNFEIQDLMSTYNQAQTLASNVQKKKDDTESGVIGKI